MGSLRTKAAMLGTILCLGSPAGALTFSFTDAGGAGLGTQARTDYQIAADYWSSVLTDNVTVNLAIAYQPLVQGNDDGLLGETFTYRADVSMAQAYAALAADRTTPLDARAVAGLPALGASSVNSAFGAVSPVTNALNAQGNGYVAGSTRLDNDGSVNNSVLSLSRADAKALGITTGAAGLVLDPTRPDAAVTLSSTAPWDFDPADGVGANQFDFLTTAIHELGHALGFISGVQNYDARSAPNGPNATAGSLEGTAVASTLDLFRYDPQGRLDWATGGRPFFSIDGGASQLFGDSQFATGTYNGGGNQPLHWRDNVLGMAPLGIMDPNAGLGRAKDVTALDLAAFDAIGWDSAVDVLAVPDYDMTTAAIYRQFATPGVPEPAVWATMLLGFGLVGQALRRRKRSWQPVLRTAA